MIQKLIVTIILIWSSNALFSQSDSTTINNEVGVTTSTNKLKANTSNTRVSPNINYNINSNKQLNINAINNNLKKYTNNNHQSILLENRPEDKDIIGVKYWHNKDVTHKKLESNLSLGTITSRTRTIKIECRDFGKIDGDRIKIYLNQQVISDNIGLKSNYFVLYVNLKEGYNRIDFEAQNQGYVGANTSELIIHDNNGKQLTINGWRLGTKQIATIGINYYK